LWREEEEEEEGEAASRERGMRSGRGKERSCDCVLGGVCV
jgi:hypothetical protein